MDSESSLPNQTRSGHRHRRSRQIAENILGMIERECQSERSIPDEQEHARAIAARACENCLAMLEEEEKRKSPAAASPTIPPPIIEKADEMDFPDFIPATVPATTEDKVDQYIREWQELAEAPVSSSDELFNLCLYSETVIVKALKELAAPQLSRFKSRLRVLGVEVRDLAYHHQQACNFGERITPDVCDFNLGPTERAQATENLRLPGGKRALVDSDIDLARQHFLPRSLLYRNQQLDEVTRSDNIRLASHLQSLFATPKSPTQTYFDLTKPQGPPDALLHGDSSSARQLPIILITASEHGSRSKNPFTLVTDVKQKVQEAHEELVDILLPSPDISTNKPSKTNSMGISTEMHLPLPVLPQGWAGEKDFKAIGTVSKATQRSIEPVGPHFLAHARRARHKRTFSEDDRIQAQESVKKVEDDDAGEISEPEDPSMLMRDAKDWKGQDHYAVLGLSKYRWKATEEQIKRAHRKKVLRHHPDKKAAAGSTEDDSFFKCIQKATEILLDPVKRRQFDSVDEAADIEPPTKKQTQKGNFFKLWGSVFKSEGRFSRNQPVPKLGDENSTKEDLENFYNFWYNFDSWRSFEYQDEDVPDDNENRDQKRHMERKNNNARKKKKTEDSARLRKLLDDCSSLDERIKKFRQDANASKNKKKLEKEAADKKAIEDAKTKKEAEEKAAKEAEETAKVEREQGKKAKEAAKTAVKKNKRVLKGSVKDANYFVKGNPPAATIDAVLNDVELVQGKVDPDEIAALAAKLTGLKLADEIKSVWSDEVKRLVDAGKLKDGDAKALVV